MIPSRHQHFQPKWMLSSRDIEVSRQLHDWDLSVIKRHFSRIQYLEMEAPILVENVGTCQESLDLFMSRISDRNTFILLCYIYHAVGLKVSKTPITFHHRSMGPNPFRILLVIVSSNYGQSMSSESREQLGYLPRKYRASR